MPGHPDTGLHQRLEVNPRLDPQAVEGPDQVLRRQVAGCALGVGAPAQTTRRGVDDGYSVCQGSHGVRERLTIGVVEMHPNAIGTNSVGVQGIQQPVNVSGRARADRVAQAELVTAQVHHPRRDSHDLVDGNVSFPGVAKTHRDVCADPQALDTGSLHDRSEHRDGLRDAAVEVPAGEGLGRAAEDRDGLHTLCERGVQTTLVGHQHRSVAAPADLTEQPQQRGGVGELGDPPGRHEGRRLDGVEPGGDEPLNELSLDLHRDHGQLVLQPVAGSDLVDGDPSGHTRLSFSLRSSHLLPPCSGTHRLSNRHGITMDSAAEGTHS